ncbi:MAG TPA: peptide-N-glycosidase F-related protein [Chitinophaga sp.]|uniref:peptide-N-glycosidase F-related protein n=1 Tax=Chitinophaga sp. TaxID=1869181 RepID=UPI002B8D8E91|nr:peptide-N-glycosidase F-related protein [Chitinophaga sp.]HVI45395.1 peptide-N-glycosidase F-related protein [Chitinophaga sp.]
MIQKLTRPCLRQIRVAAAALLLLSSCSKLTENEPIGKPITAPALPGTVNLLKSARFYGVYSSNSSTGQWTNCTDPNIAPTGTAIKPNGFTYLRKLTIAEKALIGSTVTLNLKLYAQYDGWDRTFEVAVLNTPLNTSKDSLPSLLSQRAKVAWIMTPYFLKSQTPNSIDYNSYDLSAFAQQLRRTDQDSWIYVEIGANVDYGESTAAGLSFCDNIGFLLDASLANSGSTDNVPSLYAANVINASNSTNGIFTATVTLPKALTNAKLSILTSGHGNEEGQSRRNIVSVDNTQKADVSTRIFCTPASYYDNINPNGYKGPYATWRYPVRNWCQGGALSPVLVNLGNLTAGTHTFKFDMSKLEYYVSGISAVLSNKVQAVSGNVTYGAYLSGTTN